MPSSPLPDRLEPLPAEYFAQNTLHVARDLVGALLVRELPGGKRLVARIVETEGYTEGDEAFHGWNAIDKRTGQLKPTGRGRDLFVKPGTSYVYLIYGSYWLLNVVTEPTGRGGAVLIRALEPVEGIGAMYENRAAAKRDRDLTNGPGKLTQALGIDGPEWHGIDLTAPPLYFAEEPSLPGAPAPRIATSTRIGLTRGVEAPWRYFVADHPFVSPGTPSDVAMARKKARKRGR